MFISTSSHQPRSGGLLNVKGRGHGLLDFHASTKESFNLYVPVTEGFEDQWSRTPSLVTLRRKLIGGPKFEKMRVRD